MKQTLILFLVNLLILGNLVGQNHPTPPQTKIMTLGVFHFEYPNRDAVKIKKEDQISVLEEPYQSEIIAISEALCTFKPTAIAIEVNPSKQAKIDSLYALYRNNQLELRENEIYQLGFRIANQLNIPSLHCIDDWGKYYQDVEAIFEDSTRLAQFEDYYYHSPDSIYIPHGQSRKVTGIIDELNRLNDPALIKERLAVYLLNPFKYEEQPGDFAGVDFETSRWFNRNLRIFRNIQRIPKQQERILLIIGRDHLNLLNLLIDVSKEFELVSPLPYLEKAEDKLHSSNNGNTP